MSYKLIMEQLNIVQEEIDSLERQIISELNLLNNRDFLLRRKEALFNKTEMQLLKIKKKNIKRINPVKNNYNGYQLLEIYPYYYLNSKQKERINKIIPKIINNSVDNELFNLFIYLFLEDKEKEMLSVFKILAKNKNIKTLKIMSNYFIFKNHIVNYNKVEKLINKINK